ncbi:transporter substrate-binding domain-containing protein [Tropicibacter sp. R15_0]|uniref:transporter substrate-binding domain-containing protein n=1 Tax=Tropicibacter sp. R15_0 TaxID=2821101 RepID=UPI0025710A31|nr:transporter substrate-binding domain-containing protein [Tropicibacter sp. R15_0]
MYYILRQIFLITVLAWTVLTGEPVKAQDTAQNSELTFLTVERPPFSSGLDGNLTGFSIELMRAIAEDMGTEVNFEMVDSFGEMLGQVEAGQVDGAIANISITRARESRMDFSLPIYSGGLQIMVPRGQGKLNIWQAMFSRDLALAMLAAFAMLFAGGMAMWLFERKKQPYFDRPAKEALFPSFWWALNLVVNGGFEERMPRSVFGRIFGTFLVVSSLFVVSIFVAHITAATTIQAISGTIHNVSDLDGKRVGTTRDSTASRFLLNRDVIHVGYLSLEDLLKAFEEGQLDAVVFDGPILKHYVKTEGAKHGEMLDRQFRPEDYGIALPAESALREPINVALLQLMENGEYEEIARRWFGQR